MHTFQNCMQMKKSTNFEKTRIFDIIFKSVLYLNHFMHSILSFLIMKFK